MVRDVRRRENEISGELLSESRERRYDLFFPRSLGAFTRIRLWLRGYFDAARGKVWIAHAGHIDSAYCMSLADQANLRINAEWQEANGLMFELRPTLEAAVLERNEIIRRIDNLPILRAVKDEAASISYEGDEKVSAHLVEKRQKRRSGLVAWEFAAREEALREELNDVSARTGVTLSQYQDVLDASMTHERLVRLDFIARLSCYARGASRKVSFEPHFVNDKALTTLPREENEKFFAGCLKGMKNVPKADASNENDEATVPDEVFSSWKRANGNADHGE